MSTTPNSPKAQSVGNWQNSQHLSAANLFLEIHLRRHLRELPHSRPGDLTVSILAASQLVEDHLAKDLALASQHELLRKRLRRLEKAETRIGHDANAFERHQRAHDVGEVCRQTEWVLVDHLSEVVRQLLEVHVSQ